MGILGTALTDKDGEPSMKLAWECHVLAEITPLIH